MAGLAAKAKWDVTDARAVVRAWRASGESKAAFARRLGINEQRLGYWAARVSEPSGKPVRFHRVRVTGSAELAGSIEIHISGCRVVAHSGTRTEDLRAVLSAIRDVAAC
jgi:hypothetical protein